MVEWGIFSPFLSENAIGFVPICEICGQIIAIFAANQ
jgi:hypothetical protein